MRISNGGIHSKLRLCQTFTPTLLLYWTMTTQNLLYSTMHTFSQAICLRMVSSRQSQSTINQLTQRLPKLRQKSNIPIRNNLTRGTIDTQPILKKQSSHVSCWAGTLHRNKLYQTWNLSIIVITPSKPRTETGKLVTKSIEMWSKQRVGFSTG